ncbi:MAG: 5-carboxymethyl-2-hydroxymuconate Delta-isomerase [Pseudomonadota bacterium]
MPHFSIEYSANLESEIDIGTLCDVVRRAAIETEVFPMPGIRVRAYRCDHYSIADGSVEHGFIDMSIRLREGRSLEARKKATQHVFDVVEQHLSSTINKRSLALSMEMRNIDAELSPKTGSIRKFLSGE